MDMVMCNPLRTPVGRMGGALAGLTATHLATQVLRELVIRTGLGEDDVDDAFPGIGYASGESAFGQNDGAAPFVVAARDDAEKRGLTPMLALRSRAVTGWAPETKCIGDGQGLAAMFETVR